MSGIYFHIPFCKQACHYCDFHFSTSLKYKEKFLAALKKEIKMKCSELQTPNFKVQTVYFGGGTPSLLTQKELLGIFDELHNSFDIAGDAEITIEANPDDLSEQKIRELKNTPINRLSIGVQSFFDADLKWMNRAHNAEQAVRSVQRAQDAGFHNISIDLIYGMPTLTNEKWQQNFEKAISLNIQHLSAYCLTVESNTPLAQFIKTGKEKPINDERGAEQFEMLMDFMQENGFSHYEISNFCRDGFYSKHNLGYWFDEHYLGFGPSAHSYNGIARQWNIANNQLYIKALKNGELSFNEEILSQTDKFNEYVMTSLRTMWGIDLEKTKSKFGEKIAEKCKKIAKKHQKEEFFHKIDKNKLILTNKGKLFADQISSDFFIFDEKHDKNATFYKKMAKNQLI
ncbi:MAG: coproporphyrinogen III oxidase [Flavobacteriales bacterium]|nr:MAG: coproporphyrinogen III oxidase [Flavobacteriales bacterium]